MSKILINNTIKVEGKFSFRVQLDESTKPAVIRVMGVLQTDEMIEDIRTLENSRYKLMAIHVTAEDYGSEEDMISYSFSAGKWKRKAKEGGENG